MTNKYQKRLNPLVAEMTAMETRAPRTPSDMPAKAIPFSAFSENAMEHYAKRSKHGGDPIAGANYVKYRRLGVHTSKN